MMKRRFAFLPLISVLFLTFASCSTKYFTSDGETWGTTYHIVYRNNNALDIEIKGVMSMIDSKLSMFNPESEVSLVNENKKNTVGKEFMDVFQIAAGVNALSSGVYDPTVGPLCDLWGFGRSGSLATPSDSAISAVLKTVGIADCHLENGGTICKKDPATVFDFSSVAKGYGVDCIGRMFDSLGIKDYMIEIGGEVLVRGHNPKGTPWRIQIDAPSGGMTHDRLAVAAMGPEPAAMASSGNYRNWRRDENGEIYGHTISPQTGRPVRGSVIAATVVCTDCATADALATACMASAAPDSAKAILSKAGAEGLLVYACGDSTAICATKGFDKYINGL